MIPRRIFLWDWKWIITLIIVFYQALFIPYYCLITTSNGDYTTTGTPVGLGTVLFSPWNNNNNDNDNNSKDIIATTLYELQQQTNTKLPCVQQLQQSIQSDTSKLNIISKTLLLSLIDTTLTYERRTNWLLSLNPIILHNTTSSYLSTIRTVCPLAGKNDDSSNVTNRIAIVVLMNGISLNIQEWVVYHLLIGVTTIFIYDTSIVNTIQHTSLQLALQPFIQYGYVIYNTVSLNKKDHHFYKRQYQIYNNVIQQYKNYYQWIGVIDSDEYVVLYNTTNENITSTTTTNENTNNTNSKCLYTLLNNYNMYTGVVFQWKLYTSLGVSKYTYNTNDINKTTFQQFQYTMNDFKHHVKTFVQPKYVSVFKIHHALYIQQDQDTDTTTTTTTNDTTINRFAVNLHKQRVDGPYNNNVEIDTTTTTTIVGEIRHYSMGDMQYALYDKICGFNNERTSHQSIRIELLKLMFDYHSDTTTGASTNNNSTTNNDHHITFEDPVPLPSIHSDLHQFIFGTNNNEQQ